MPIIYDNSAEGELLIYKRYFIGYKVTVTFLHSNTNVKRCKNHDELLLLNK